MTTALGSPRRDRAPLLAIACFATLVPLHLNAQAVGGTSTAGIFYEVSGKGEPVVLIHGFSLDRRIWQPQVSVLERRFRVFNDAIEAFLAR